MNTIKYTKSLLVIVFTAAMATACSDENYFDKDAYNKLIEDAFPVSRVDTLHDWRVVNSADVEITLAKTAEGTSIIRIYDANPTSSIAYLLAKDSLASGEIMTASINYLVAAPTAYVALTAADGTLAIYQCAIADGKLSATIDDALVPLATFAADSAPSLAETPPTLRYCFEDTYPSSGDYDFNDCVLDITPIRTSATRVTYEVSLAAVGSTKQIAAAMRLKGIKYNSDLVNVTISGDLNAYSTSNVSNDLLAGKFPYYHYTRDASNDLVVYLFNDAHYAFMRATETTGSVYRTYINTVSRTDSITDHLNDQPAVTCRIAVELASTIAADEAMKQSVIDPFIVAEYNGARWETHTYQWKQDPALITYDNTSDYDINRPWALCLPGSFLYPKESTPIGTYSKGTFSGAYQAAGFSFADWAMDRLSATTWYLYPSTNYVYR